MVIKSATKKTTTRPLSGSKFACEIIDIPIINELEESYLAYSMSVITDRAIPDVRDGLKPVQRRIIYEMYKENIKAKTPYKKSAKVVGGCMSNFHPHGDASIYDALVRMGQDFSMGIPLIDGHGNFGTQSNPPAASRYTECRLSPIAMELVDEIDQETVPFKSNFDGETVEPIYLPAKIPNLLINGATGIAVGLATNMPSYNLKEVCSLTNLLLSNPQTQMSKILKVLPGPDFPTGGEIIDFGGIEESYKTGRGTFTIRAKAEIDQISSRRQGIVITELPFQIGPEEVIEKIQILQGAGKLKGVSSIKDFSDRKSGMRLVVEVKQGANPVIVLKELYKLTPLQRQFSINNTVLVNGLPKTLGIRDLVIHFLDHRMDIIIKRSKFRLRKAKERAHIIQGLLIALANILEVIDVIRKSQDTQIARTSLMSKFKLSEIQANHILEMPLRRLTSLEVKKLKEEYKELTILVKDLNEILKSKERRVSIISSEISEIAKTYGENRKSQLSYETIEDNEEADVPNETIDTSNEETISVTLSTTGVVGRGNVSIARPGRNDIIVATASTTAHSPIWLITSHGRAVGIDGIGVPEIEGRSRGEAVKTLFGLNSGEKPISIVGAKDYGPLCLVTSNGVVKRVAFDELRKARGGKIIELEPGDSVINAFLAPDETDIVIVSDDSYCVRYPANLVRPQGKSGKGMLGAKLHSGAKVIWAGSANSDVLVVCTANGIAKATSLEEFPSKNRGGLGIRIFRLKDNDKITLAFIGNAKTLLVLSEKGPETISINPTRRDGPGSKKPVRWSAIGLSRSI